MVSPRQIFYPGSRVALRLPDLRWFCRWVSKAPPAIAQLLLLHRTLPALNMGLFYAAYD